MGYYPNPFFNKSWQPPIFDNSSYKWGGGINENPSFAKPLNTGYGIQQAPNMIEQFQLNSQQVAPNLQPQQQVPGAFGIANAVMGGASVIGNAVGMGNEAKAINTEAPRLTEDYTGNPVYNIGQRALENDQIKPRGSSGGELLSAAGQGASAGAAFGPPGMIIGAVVGTAINAIGGARRKRLMRERKNTATRNLNQARTRYNQAYETAGNQRRSIQSYYDSINTENRLRQLYG